MDGNQGRLELLFWLNDFLETDYTKIEHLSDGIAYCQIFDAILPPGTVPLSKLDFNAKFPDECARNLKILDEVLQKLGAGRTVPVQSLAKGGFQENKEFLKWCQHYVNMRCPDGLPEYPAFHKRDMAQKSQALKKKGKESITGATKKVSAKSPPVVNNNLLPNKVAIVKQVRSRSFSQEVEKEEPEIRAEKKEEMEDMTTRPQDSDNEAVDAHSQRRAQDLQQLGISLENELRERLSALLVWYQSLKELRLERDFYYEKLLNIEKLCTNVYPNRPVAREVMAIMSKEVPAFKESQTHSSEENEI